MRYNFRRMSNHSPAAVFLRDRLPPRQDVLLVLGGCAFIVYLWAIFNLLYTLPTWLRRLTTSELLGVISYVLAFALFESLLVWGGLVVTAFVLPGRWLRAHFVPQAMSVVLVTAVWSIAAYLNYGAIATNLWLMSGWMGSYLAAVLLCAYLSARSGRVDAAWRAVLQKAAVPGGLYAALGVLSLLVILLRNIE